MAGMQASEITREEARWEPVELGPYIMDSSGERVGPNSAPKRIGAAGERLAAEHLERLGFEVVERNWRCAFGEADIVAVDLTGETVFVEVKTRWGSVTDEVYPELAVGPAKRRTYCKLAAMYLLDHPGVDLVRFDVVGITLRARGTAHLRHLVNAFVQEQS